MILTEFKKPKSNLPWKIHHGYCGDGITPREYTEITTENSGKVYSENWNSKPVREDLEYMVFAANNLPKAIELLEKINWLVIKHSDINEKVREFLKSLDEKSKTDNQ